MAPIVFDSSRQLHDFVGKEVVVSEWLTITQAEINSFADATGDRQWIHVDAVRAVKESPFKTTIAHGFLTLSLLPRLLGDSLEFSSARLKVNYGFNKLRFPDVVPVGARVRAHFVLQSMENIQNNGVQIVWLVTMEREDSGKPCLVAEWLVRLYEATQ